MHQIAAFLPTVGSGREALDFLHLFQLWVGMLESTRSSRLWVDKLNLYPYPHLARTQFVCSSPDEARRATAFAGLFVFSLEDAHSEIIDQSEQSEFANNRERVLIRLGNAVTRLTKNRETAPPTIGNFMTLLARGRRERSAAEFELDFEAEEKKIAATEETEVARALAAADAVEEKAFDKSEEDKKIEIEIEQEQLTRLLSADVALEKKKEERTQATKALEENLKRIDKKLAAGGIRISTEKELKKEKEDVEKALVAKPGEDATAEKVEEEEEKKRKLAEAAGAISRKAEKTRERKDARRVEREARIRQTRKEVRREAKGRIEAEKVEKQDARLLAGLFKSISSPLNPVNADYGGLNLANCVSAPTAGTDERTNSPLMALVHSEVAAMGNDTKRDQFAPTQPDAKFWTQPSVEELRNIAGDGKIRPVQCR